MAFMVHNGEKESIYCSFDGSWCGVTILRSKHGLNIPSSNPAGLRTENSFPDTDIDSFSLTTLESTSQSRRCNAKGIVIVAVISGGATDWINSGAPRDRINP